MAPFSRDGEKGRRKSFFTKVTGLTPINIESGNASQESGQRKKLSKRPSILGLGSAASEDLAGSASPVNGEGSNSTRPRALGRPSSLFGSFGKKSMNSGEGETGRITSSPAPQAPEDGLLHTSLQGPGRTIRIHGEVQTGGGMFARRKKEYVVLTDTHLIRFKSQARAFDAFPSLRLQNGRQSSSKHQSTNSIGSQDAQSLHSHTSGEGEVRISLGQIVTAYKLEDGRPWFTTEIVHLDEECHGMGSIQLRFGHPVEADLWLSSIRGAAQQVRFSITEPYPQRVVNYLVQSLEAVDDYDINRFKIFRTVRRTASRSSSDNLQKMDSALSYMVIGINRVHMIPIPDVSDPSARLVSPKGSKNVFGLVTLVGINISAEDDRFELAFRTPLQTVKLLELAASATSDIAIDIFRAIHYLKPQWIDHAFAFAGPKHLLNTLDEPLAHQGEEYGYFDRTLVAYCMAYNCNPNNIQYAVDWEVEDAPEFRLFPPTKSDKYSLLELLAIFRSLRYNECFRSISFKNIDLHSMHGLHDQYGTDHVAWATHSGISLQKYFNIQPQEKSLLYQEVQALALKSRVLRRLDFAYSLPRRRPRDTFDVEEEGVGAEKDPGCEIVAGLFSLYRDELTDIDWIVLSGIELGETDFEDLVPALHAPGCRLRALECSHSGLNDRGIMQILTNLEHQNATLESVNVADNPGKIHLERFQISMSCFQRLRRLDLSRITRTLGEEPLFTPEVMLSWQLEELIMNGVPVNDKTLDTISGYLASDKSQDLRVLQMDQCNLSGSHVAILMRSMTRSPGEARNIELHVSANKLEKGVAQIAKAIEENHAPSHLVARMIEYTKEEHFRRVLRAIRKNTTIRCLDISKASLPYDASPETCDALKLLFEQNKTLEDLDISGEHSHLEVTRFGIGLNHALTGLKRNNTLKSLRIEYQNLGLEGANTLSSVLEINRGLTHIYCEHNNLNLQGFTILVNAIAQNHTVLDIPFMDNDKGESMKQWMRETTRVTPRQHDHNMKASVRRTLTTLKVSKPPKPEPTPPDIEMVVRVLREKWDSEVKRLVLFLTRNRNLAAGIEAPAPDHQKTQEAMRPTTALSDRQCIEQALQDSTPKVELGNPVDGHVHSQASLDLKSSSSSEGRGSEKSKSIASGSIGDEKSIQRKSDESDEALEIPSITTNEKILEFNSGGFKIES